MYQTTSETWTIGRFFSRIYSIMAMGIAVSAIVSYVTIAFFPENMRVLNSPAVLLVWLLEIGLVIGLTKVARDNSKFALPGFLLFSALNGFVLSFTIAVYMNYYSPSLVAQAFLTTCGMFTIMAVIGARTKKDLSGIGQAAYAALWGLIFAGILSIFFPNGMVGLLLSGISVIVFSGLIAWDNQMIKRVYEENHGQVSEGWAVSMGLHLYLDFINLFINILRIFGVISKK